MEDFFRGEVGTNEEDWILNYKGQFFEDMLPITDEYIEREYTIVGNFIMKILYTIKSEERGSS